MPEGTTPSPGKKLSQFIKKNKTLTAVIAVVGGYFGYKELKKNSEPGSVEVVETPGQYEGPEYPSRELSQEGINGEINRIDEQIREIEEMDKEGSESHVESEGESETPSGGGSPEAPAAEGPTTETNAGGITIHGRFFAGATSSRIAGTGKLGDKQYVEYVITFPGRQEHWQFFPASGNWREANNSATGPGKNKPPAKNPGNGGGGGGNQPVSGPPQTSPPAKDPANPNAVNTGNRCVDGGVGGHTPPAGYHLYCKNGWIWRAPNASNKEGVSPGKPLPAPAPAPAPAAPSCPAGTVANIQQNRNEVNRLTNEIQSLKANKPKGWAANVANKEGLRAQCQGAVDRGRAQPGCGNV